MCESTTICEGFCGEEVPLNETETCERCGLDLLCSCCIGSLDHNNPDTGQLCGGSSGLMNKTESRYKANFLWPHEEGSMEEAGYEFVNGLTEEYREQWWNILLEVVANQLCERKNEHTSS